jgi:hypothetical protein
VDAPDPAQSGGGVSVHLNFLRLPLSDRRRSNWLVGMRTSRIRQPKKCYDCERPGKLPIWRNARSRNPQNSMADDPCCSRSRSAPCPCSSLTRAGTDSPAARRSPPSSPTDLPNAGANGKRFVTGLGVPRCPASHQAVLGYGFSLALGAKSASGKLPAKVCHRRRCRHPPRPRAPPANSRSSTTETTACQ